MPIPAQSIPTRVAAESLSTGISTELDTHGREAALRVPTLTREDRTQRGRCSVSSSSIRSHSSQVKVSPFLALFGHGAMSELSPLCARKRTFADASAFYGVTLWSGSAVTHARPCAPVRHCRTRADTDRPRTECRSPSRDCPTVLPPAAHPPTSPCRRSRLDRDRRNRPARNR